MASFRDLMTLIENGEEGFTGPYTCFVANFFAAGPSPRPYTYQGCTVMKANNSMCRKSIEGPVGGNCNHEARLPENHGHLYRFDVLLFDANVAGPPVRAVIFEAAQNLLEQPASSFHKLDESRQTDLLRAMTFTAPLVHVWIRFYVGGDGETNLVVHNLDLAKIRHGGTICYGTPMKEFYTRHGTPLSSFRETCNAGAESEPEQKLNISEADIAILQRSFTEALKILSTQAPAATTE